MTVDELRSHANKPVTVWGCTLILRGIKSAPDGKTIALLQDRHHKRSFVIARAEDIKQNSPRIDENAMQGGYKPLGVKITLVKMQRRTEGARGLREGVKKNEIKTVPVLRGKAGCYTRL